MMLIECINIGTTDSIGVYLDIFGPFPLVVNTCYENYVKKEQSETKEKKKSWSTARMSSGRV
jgi:hypothetical protein